MTAYHDVGFDVSFEAKADLNDYQYHFVQSEGPASGSAGVVNVGTGGSNTGPAGVLQDDPRAGGAGKIRMMGVTKLRVNAAGSTIVFGRLLTCGSDGHGEPFDYASALAGSPLAAHAIALSYTTADDVVIQALINPYMCVVAGS